MTIKIAMALLPLNSMAAANKKINEIKKRRGE